MRSAGDGRDEGQWRAARQSAGAEAPPVDLLLHGLDTDALKGGRSGQAAVMDELRGSLCEYDRHCGGSSLVPGKKPVRQEMPRKAQTDSIHRSSLAAACGFIVLVRAVLTARRGEMSQRAAIPLAALLFCVFGSPAVACGWGHVVGNRSTLINLLNEEAALVEDVGNNL